MQKKLVVPPSWSGEEPSWEIEHLRQLHAERELLHTTRIKSYPAAGTWEALTASRAIFREPGYEPARESQVLPEAHTEPRRTKSKDDANIIRSVRRARVKFRDLALSTEFKYFVTLTLDKSKISRFDMDEITRRMQAWCSNQVQRHGLAYILVPERHQDGAVHFHGFFNDALEAVDSGTISRPGDKPRRPRSAKQRAEWLEQGGHIVYNLPAWSLGFTTAIELYGSYPAAVAYCCKYVGKQQEGEQPAKIGGRWYYSGGNLARPEITYADLMACDQAQNDGAYVFDIPEARCCFVKETGNL